MKHDELGSTGALIRVFLPEVIPLSFCHVAMS